MDPIPRRQSGAATLAIALLLLIATTIMSFALARNGLLEQHILRNELWASEALHRAEAILEQALHELQDLPLDTLAWQAEGAEWEIADLPVNGLALPPASSGEAYDLDVRLRRKPAVPGLLEVVARAQGGGGSQARVRQYLRLEPAHRTRVPGTWRDF